MKDFSVEDVLHYQTSVSRSRIRISDKRTGEITETVLYHPGDNYPLTNMRRIIEGYGYGVVSCDTEDTVTGVIPWEEMFRYLERKGSCDDRSELQTKR